MITILNYYLGTRSDLLIQESDLLMNSRLTVNVLRLSNRVRLLA